MNLKVILSILLIDIKTLNDWIIIYHFRFKENCDETIDEKISQKLTFTKIKDISA